MSKQTVVLPKQFQDTNHTLLRCNKYRVEVSPEKLLFLGSFKLVFVCRFIIPRDHFIKVNQKEDEKITGGKRGFCNERAYKSEDDQ